MLPNLSSLSLRAAPTAGRNDAEAGPSGSAPDEDEDEDEVMDEGVLPAPTPQRPPMTAGEREDARKALQAMFEHLSFTMAHPDVDLATLCDYMRTIVTAHRQLSHAGIPGLQDYFRIALGAFGLDSEALRQADLSPYHNYQEFFYALCSAFGPYGSLAYGYPGEGIKDGLPWDDYVAFENVVNAGALQDYRVASIEQVKRYAAKVKDVFRHSDRLFPRDWNELAAIWFGPYVEEFWKDYNNIVGVRKIWERRTWMAHYVRGLNAKTGSKTSLWNRWLAVAKLLQLQGADPGYDAGGLYNNGEILQALENLATGLADGEFTADSDAAKELVQKIKELYAVGRRLNARVRSDLLEDMTSFQLALMIGIPELLQLFADHLNYYRDRSIFDYEYRPGLGRQPLTEWNDMRWLSRALTRNFSRSAAYRLQDVAAPINPQVYNALINALTESLRSDESLDRMVMRGGNDPEQVTQTALNELDGALQAMVLNDPPTPAADVVESLAAFMYQLSLIDAEFGGDWLDQQPEGHPVRAYEEDDEDEDEGPDEDSGEEGDAEGDWEADARSQWYQDRL
jgi:hypothetical protein